MLLFMFMFFPSNYCFSLFIVGEKSLAIAEEFKRKAAATAAAVAAANAASVKPVKAELDLTKDDSIEETSPVKSTAPMWRKNASSSALAGLHNKGTCTFSNYICACSCASASCLLILLGGSFARL